MYKQLSVFTFVVPFDNEDDYDSVAVNLKVYNRLPVDVEPG